MTRSESNRLLLIVTALCGAIIAGGIALDRWQDNRRDLAEPSAVSNAALVVGDRVTAIVGDPSYDPSTNTFQCTGLLPPLIDVVKARSGYVAVIVCDGRMPNVSEMDASDCRPQIRLDVIGDGWRARAWCPEEGSTDDQ